MSSSEELWRDLQLAQQEERHEQVLKTAESLLKAGERGETAQLLQTVRLTAMLELSHWDAALALVHKLPELWSDARFAFHAAYVQYRNGQYTQALATAELVRPSHAGVRHLRAQCHYKMGRFDLAAACLEGVNESDERTNLCASLCSNGDLQTAVDCLRSEETPELLYNAAVATQRQGRLELALQLLLRAETLEEEDGDVARMQTQRAFVLQLSGRSDDAAELYGRVLDRHERHGDKAAAAVALNNSACLDFAVAKERREVIAALKKVTRVVVDSREVLTSPQLRRASLNRALLLIAAGKAEQALSIMSGHKGVLLRAAVHYARGAVDKCVKVLSHGAGNRAESAEVRLRCVLAQAHVAASRGLFARAVELLESLRTLGQEETEEYVALCGHVTASRGFRSTQAALLMRCGRSGEALELLESSVDAAARAELAVRVRDFAAARDAFADVGDEARSQAYAALCDVMASNAAEVPLLTKDSESEEMRLLRPTLADKKTTKRTKKKKKRKTTATTEVDPERWVPKWARASAQKKKGKKGQQPTFRGAQGNAAVDESLAHAVTEETEQTAAKRAARTLSSRRRNKHKKGAGRKKRR